MHTHTHTHTEKKITQSSLAFLASCFLVTEPDSNTHKEKEIPIRTVTDWVDEEKSM